MYISQADTLPSQALIDIESTSGLSATASNGVCTLNGETVPCDQLYDQFEGVIAPFLAIGAVFVLLGLLSFAFWIWMLVDIIQRGDKVKDQALWIVLMVLAGPLGSLIYFFAVRQRLVKKTQKKK